MSSSIRIGELNLRDRHSIFEMACKFRARHSIFCIWICVLYGRGNM